MRPLVAVLLTDSQETAWWWAVILGFVVVLAVAALLTILVLEVRVIGRNVTRVKASLQVAADNTGDTVLIGQVAEGVEAVLAEGLKHHLFLGRVLEKVRM